MSLFGLFDSSNIPHVDAEQLRLRMKKEKPILLDVREVFEHQSENIPGSKLIPLGELPGRISELEKFREKEIIVYCRSGSRSMSACKFLQKQGFNVTNLSGGMNRW
jgi:rhodanese-related sulfurtransferase